MTSSTAPMTGSAPLLSDLEIARMACEGKSMLIDSRGIADDMLAGYSAPYVRAVMAAPGAPRPIQVANNGAYLFVRIEVALYLLARERVTAENRRTRTKAATAQRLGPYVAPGIGGRRMQNAVAKRKDAPSKPATRATAPAN